jgi:hypothetical protein
MVPFNFGMGPSTTWRVNLVYPAPADAHKFVHDHIGYVWPPPPDGIYKWKCKHAVLPVRLADIADLKERLNEHLAILVDDHFEEFPAYESQLKVLPEIYKLYKTLENVCWPYLNRTNLLTRHQPRGSMLNIALKLLVLVRTSGDVTVDDTDPCVQEIMSSVLPSITGLKITPCFVRSQLGEVMHELAQELFRDLIHRLWRCSLQRNCSHWQTNLCCFAVSTMAFESAEYNEARDAYHSGIDFKTQQSFRTLNSTFEGYELPMEDIQGQPAFELGKDNHICDRLLRFYRACFSTCHRRLDADITDASSVDETDATAAFVRNMRDVLAKAKPYIEERSQITEAGVGTMSTFFDRRLAKLFIMD